MIPSQESYHYSRRQAGPLSLIVHSTETVTTNSQLQTTKMPINDTLDKTWHNHAIGDYFKSTCNNTNPPTVIRAKHNKPKHTVHDSICIA